MMEGDMEIATLQSDMEITTLQNVLGLNSDDLQIEYIYVALSTPKLYYIQPMTQEIEVNQHTDDDEIKVDELIADYLFDGAIEVDELIAEYLIDGAFINSDEE